LPEAKDAAERLNIQLNIVEVRSAADFDTAFSALAKTRSKAFLTLPSNMLISNRKEVLDAARKHGLAGFYTSADWAQQGGLFAYAASDADAIKRVANYVSRILKGAKAADLPIEQPTKFELFVNLKTARALNIKIPSSILLQATKVIE
jgi:putative ABC transport system substrate-binding protein